MKAKGCMQHIEDTNLELLKLQTHFKNRLVEKNGRLRRENIRIHGVQKGAEDSARSMNDFI